MARVRFRCTDNAHIRGDHVCLVKTLKGVQGVYIEIYRIGIHRIWHELLTEMITLFAYTMLVRLHFGAP